MIYNLAQNKENREKTMVITGALGSIGTEVTRIFAEKGINLVLIDEKNGIREFADCVSNEYGVKTYGIQMNFFNHDSIEKMLKEINHKFENIDMLVHIAGRVLFQETTNIEEQMVTEQMNKNVIGTYYVTRAIGERMIEQGTGGKIICITSQDEYTAMKKHIGYQMSKAAIISMVKQFAIEWEKHDINVNVISPVVYHSNIDEKEWNNGLHLYLREEMEENLLPEADMIAASIKFLTSVEANMMSGEDFVIDIKCSYEQEQKSA